jgi:uncharacterized protein YacL
MIQNRTLFFIRAFFLVLCACGGWLLSLVMDDWRDVRWVVVTVALLLGVLVVLVDILLKGFSLRGLSALTFGLAMGALVSFLLSSSPLFAYGDPSLLFLSRLALFVVCMYLGAVIALRGKDEFYFVIPYVRFVPHEVETPLVIVDSSALIDGRIAKVAESGFISAALIIPRFVLTDLQRIADAAEPARRARGRRGLETLNQLRRTKHLDLRIHESEVSNRQEVESKLVFLAQSMKAKLLTTDYNLARMAEFHGVAWLNLHALAKAVRPELTLGETIEVDLVKPGKEDTQAVGYLDDGSMVVVSDARALVGRKVTAEVVSVLPSAGGKMVFAKLQQEVIGTGGS